MCHFKGFLPSLSHSSLLEWWFNSNKLICHPTRIAAFQISNILDTILYSSTLTSGFEFHHYNSDVLPDYLVFLSSTDLSVLPSAVLPTWWPNYIDVLRSSAPSSSFHLIPENWLEFDYIEPNLVLNGLWQRVFEPKRSFDPKVWRSLAQSLSGSFISYESLTDHNIIKLLVESFSLPQQIGLMYGRSQTLKLMFQLDSDLCFLNFKNLISGFGSDILNVFQPIVDYFISDGLVLRPAISFDIDLLSSSLLPQNISIEIHQNHQIGRKLMKETSYFLSSVLHINDEQIISLSRVLDDLPYGQSFSFSNNSSSNFMLNNISRLNHLKVQFRYNSWHLKSYVKLIQSFS